MFPTPEDKNLMICVSGIGASNEFSCFITNQLPNVQTLSNGQCFPLFLYSSKNEEPNLFSSLKIPNFEKDDKKYAITDSCLKNLLEKYDTSDITKEDIFFYVYGLLHSPEYRNKYKNNLKKELPRIPFVKDLQNFSLISEIGRKLSKLHIDFESVEKYPVTFKEGDLRLLPIEDPINFFKVEKMRFMKIKKTVMIYNKI